MADTDVATEKNVEQQPEQPVEQPVEQPSEAGDDIEPGGDDPQAVRARKEYRQRKRLEARVQEMERSAIAREARLKAIEEERSRQPATKEKVFTPQELQAGIDAGTITYAEAANYLAEQRAKETADRILTQERERSDREYRASRAQAEVDAYVVAEPWLSDRADSRRRALEVEYAKLTDPHGLYRMPEGPAAELLVLEKVLGPLDRVRAKVAVDRTSRAHSDVHVESGAAGVGRESARTGNAALDKMPQHYREYWDKSQTPVAEREKEAKLYWERERLRGRK